MKKRGQAWGFDLTIASIIFIGGIIVFYVYALNTPSQGNDKIDSLTYEGNSISDALLSEGFPQNWEANNVVKLGLTTNNKINQTKLENLYALSQSDYQKTKLLFNTKYNYFINASSPLTIKNSPISGIGIQENNSNNLIKISRFTIYDEKPITLTIEVWE